ncbi:MAG: DUF3450 domain-containing protein [Gammaproteobacteria bacterium]|nr:DUF3450 domain-containing protein [Gammaproteobacteria bacterium]
MLKPMKLNKVLAIAVNAFLIVCGGVLMAAGPLDSSMNIEKEMDKAAASTQKTVDKLADQTADDAQTYQMTLQSIDSLKAYNASIEGYIRRQEAEMASIQAQMDGIDGTERAVIPMMEDMIESLTQFVDLDIPFLIPERKKRINFLGEMMLRVDVSNSEKYRKILEAYQVENDYGSSVESYEQEIQTAGGVKKTVDFLRFGRIALVYQSRDEESRAYWDNNTNSWVPIGDEYRRSIREGIKMARGQANLGLINLPISSAKPAR